MGNRQKLCGLSRASASVVASSIVGFSEFDSDKLVNAFYQTRSFCQKTLENKAANGNGGCGEIGLDTFCDFIKNPQRVAQIGAMSS